MNDTSSLSAVAELFGRLLIREVDEAFLDALDADTLAELRALGLDVRRDELEDLATQYFAVLLHPTEHPPLVQSLCVSGHYESASTASIRDIAERAGVEFENESARGAPVDHLGAELFLWAELSRRSSSAAEFAQQHLSWARQPLQQIARGEGFYARLSGRVHDFLDVICESAA
ncbi:MAG: molecular chaperone TorD family protein [Planctomycetota bacterium]